MQNIIWNIISIAIGALITWFVAWRYYVRAALALEAETKKLRNLLRITLQALEDAGMVKLNRDPSGQIVGMTHNVNISLSASASLKTSELNEIKTKKNSQ